MHHTPHNKNINMLKKELSTLLTQNNYDLLDPRVLALSRQLDELLLPTFKQQLDFYNYFTNNPLSYKTTIPFKNL